jgi:hypothetical protein
MSLALMFHESIKGKKQWLSEKKAFNFYQQMFLSGSQIVSHIKQTGLGFLGTRERMAIYNILSTQ